MKAKLTLLLVPALAAVCFAQEDSAHLNEIALGLGGLPALSRSDTPRLDTGSGVAFQVNYGRRFFKDRKVAIYGEINALANPLRDDSSSIPTATHDFASLYITPGIRVSLAECLISARESKFASGDSLPFEAKRATSTRARQPTASRQFRAGNTMC